MVEKRTSSPTGKAKSNGKRNAAIAAGAAIGSAAVAAAVLFASKHRGDRKGALGKSEPATLPPDAPVPESD